tara:strand:- start:457 stop:810 length:354 start_codon:yes stop_codon:yes gene_type:complete
MNITKLTFDDNIGHNVSVGDTVHYCAVSTLGGFSSQLDEANVLKLGTVLNVAGNSLIVELTGTNPLPSSTDFIFTSKDDEVNISSLIGHFAEVKMKNTSTEKAELFRITLGFNESSK